MIFPFSILNPIVLIHNSNFDRLYEHDLENDISKLHNDMPGRKATSSKGLLQFSLPLKRHKIIDVPNFPICFQIRSPVTSDRSMRVRPPAKLLPSPIRAMRTGCWARSQLQAQMLLNLASKMIDAPGRRCHQRRAAHQGSYFHPPQRLKRGPTLKYHPMIQITLRSRYH